MSIVTLEEVEPKSARASLQDLLARFLHSVSGTKGIVVADKKGLTVGSEFRCQACPDAAAVAAMAALALQASSSIATNLNYPRPACMTIEGPSWTISVAPSKSGLVVGLVISGGDANVGLLKLALARLLDSIDSLLIEL